MPEPQIRHWTGPEPPALTISQPWAHAIIYGNPPKDVENRTWATTWRGRLYIHASRSDDPDAPGSAWAAGNAWHSHAHGAIIGYVTVKDCITHLEAWGAPGRAAKVPTSPWMDEDSPMHWLLADPVALPRPLPCAGKLGLWKVSPVQIAAMRLPDPG